MKISERLSDKEYENLSLEYEQNPPKLSGKPGFLTTMRERTLILELLPLNYARIVYMNAKLMSMSPSEFIQYAIKAQITADEAKMNIADTHSTISADIVSNSYWEKP